MPRQARLVIPNIAHHITQRGNYRQNVFTRNEDFEIYGGWFNWYAEKYKLEVLAYCLMNNHVHFIVIPKRDEALARMFNTVHMKYAQYVNRKRKQKGHLWQGRFFSCILDDEHLYRAMRYVERNPIRAKMVKEAWKYKWSSARSHIGVEKKGVIKVNNNKQLMRTSEWKKYLKEEDKDMVKEMRLKTNKGLAIREEKFIKYIEKKLKRSLICLNPGRPSKSKRALSPLKRFPKDFMFQLNPGEFKSLIFQFGMSKKGRGGRRYPPYVFTEQGVAMLSSVLNSERAIQVNIQIMRTFTKLRQILSTHKELKRKIEEMEKKYDKQFKIVFDAINKLLEPPKKPRKRIGF